MMQGDEMNVNHFAVFTEYLKTKDDNLLLMMVSNFIKIVEK